MYPTDFNIVQELIGVTDRWQKPPLGGGDNRLMPTSRAGEL